MGKKTSRQGKERIFAEKLFESPSFLMNFYQQCEEPLTAAMAPTPSEHSPSPPMDAPSSSSGAQDQIVVGRSYSPSPEQFSENNAGKMQCRRDGLSSHLTLVNFVKGMIGSGILTLPIVFRQAGLWTAFGLVFIFGFLNTLTMASLVKCAHHLGNERSRRSDGEKGQKEGGGGGEPMSYGKVMEAALGGSFGWARPWARPAKFFVNGTIVLLQMGIGCIKYDFIVAHLRELFDEFTAFHASALAWALIIFPPMVLLNFTRTLQRIALLNTFGNLFMFAAYGVIFYHLLQSPHQTAQLPWFTNAAGVLAACGSILYCFEGQAMVLPMENKMKRPSEMVGPFGVLSTGMALTAIFDAAVGFLGYSKFGDAIQGSVTLNLPPTPLLTSVKLIFTGISFLDYLLQQYVTIQMLWPPLNRRLSASTQNGQFLQFSEYLFRCLLVAITMFIAIFVPNLEQIMPLVGFSGGVFLAFVFPPLIDFFTFFPILMANGRHPYFALARRLTFNLFFLSIGIFGSLIGLSSSLESIFASTK